MEYRIVYENADGALFEIKAFDSLARDLKTYLFSFWVLFEITNCINHHSFKFRIGLTLNVLMLWGIPFDLSNIPEKESEENKEKAKMFLIREGFKKVQEHLDQGITEDKEFLFTRDNSPEKFETHKQCNFLEEQENKIICKISNEFTTYPRCEECNFPEYFAQCKHLKNFRHRKIVTNTADIYEIIADCDKRKEELKGSELKNCLMKLCFEPITSPSPKKLPRVEEDKIVREIIEKIDNINLLMKSKYRFELFKIQQQAVWNILPKLCNTEENFTQHILALKNIMDWMNIDELKTRITGKRPKEGSINYLETFLQEQYPTLALGFIVKPLRKINKISQGFPRHKDTPEVIEAIKSLGIEYPVKDWQKLWDKIILDFLFSLRILEQILI